MNDTFWGELYHHGVDGQKWGVKHGPPYPLEDNPRDQAQKKKEAAAAKARKRIERKKKRIKKAKARIEKKEAKRKAKTEKREREEKERFEKEKQKILKSPKETYKYRNQFTNEELQAAIKRFEFEQKINSLSESQMKSGLNYVNTALNYAEAGIRGWNMVARVANGLSSSQLDLPYIGPPKVEQKDKRSGKS